jgi:hypothetical protein
MRFEPGFLLLSGLCCTLLFLSPVQVEAQRRGAQPNMRTLDSAAEKAENEYIATLADLAKQYDEAGDKQKASEMLRNILKLKPDAEVVKNKLKQYEEAIFKDNVQTIDVDVSAGWVATGILVSKDKPVRIEADGTYRFSINESVGPGGFSNNNVANGVVEGIPCGALMAVVGKMSETRGRKPNERDLPRPFLIGTQKEITPKETGPLLFRVNTPEGAKCIGKIKVKVTGNIAVMPR